MTDQIPTYDTLEEREKAWEKERKGIIADLQRERGERQQLEERLAQVEQNLNPAGAPNGDTPEARVNLLAADPDAYISEIVSEALEPVTKHLSALVVERKLDRARKRIATREGIDPDEVDDKLGADLIRIGKERGFTDLDPEKGVLNAYDILLQERKEKEEREAQRSQAINGQAAETIRHPSASGAGPRFTRDQIARMSREEYEANREKIAEAQSKGLIT